MIRAIYIGVLLLFLTNLQAAATILFASSEDTGFTAVNTTGSTANCSSSACRSSFVRSAVQVGNSTTVADPPGNRLQTPTFTSVSLLWVHWIWGTANTGLPPANTNNEQALLIRSPDGVSRIVLRGTGTAGVLKISTRNSAGTITDLATASGALPNAGTVAVDLLVNYTCSSSGAVQLYIAGVQVINYSGNPCTDAATQLNQVDLASPNNGITTPNCQAANTNATYCWSEVIIADEDTRGMALWNLPPQAAGNTQSWLPNTLANINKAQISDTTSIATSANSSLSQWTTPTTFPNGAWSVKAIVQEARIQRGISGPQNFEWGVRTIDGSNNVTGSVNPTTSFSNFNNQIWSTNPHTSSAWATTDIASGFNLFVESLP